MLVVLWAIVILLVFLRSSVGLLIQKSVIYVISVIVNALPSNIE